MKTSRLGQLLWPSGLSGGSGSQGAAPASGGHRLRTQRSTHGVTGCRWTQPNSKPESFPWRGPTQGTRRIHSEHLVPRGSRATDLGLPGCRSVRGPRPRVAHPAPESAGRACRGGRGASLHSTLLRCRVWLRQAPAAPCSVLGDPLVSLLGPHWPALGLSQGTAGLQLGSDHQVQSGVHAGRSSGLS